MSRAFTICMCTVLLFTLGSAAIATIPHWNDPDPDPETGGCMFNGMSGRSLAMYGGVVCGLGGFIVSLIVGPAVAITDSSVRRYGMRFDAHQMQAQSNALSLLRASSVPSTQQKAELLRAAQPGPATPPQELLRSVRDATQSVETLTSPKAPKSQ